jgi:HlyD family secretion protein
VKRKTKIILIAVGIIVIGGLIAANLQFDRKSRVDVQTETIGRLDLESIVSASGQVEAKRQVNVSANTLGKVTRLAVEEGDRVEKGDFLLEIDPTPFQANVASLEATLAATMARLESESANRRKAEIDLERLDDLFQKNLVPEEDLDTARTSYSVAIAQENAARQDVLRNQADLRNARHNLDQVTIHAELSGVVTRLNIEAGENVVTGTMNNPGTVLLTIADLSEIEAEIEVDETDVVDVRLGQEAGVIIDAYPDRTFAGIVTQVGNSAILGSSGGGPQAVNFRVTVTLTEQVPNVRPGLSCTADITVATRTQAVAVPIQSVTIRKPPDPEEPSEPETGGMEAAAAEPDADDQVGAAEPAEAADEQLDTVGPEDEPARPADSAGEGEEEIEEVEGVFVVREGEARFVPIEIGISGEKHFEVLSGIDAGDVVVTGPYRAIRELQHGDAVKAAAAASKAGGDD